MKHILLMAVALLCASCSMVPTPVPSGKGGGMIAMLVGGKGVLNYNADGSMAYTYSNEKSMQHFLQTAASLGMSYYTYLGQAAKEVTARYEAGQITIQQRDAGLRAIEGELIRAKGAGISEGIQAGGPINPITITPQ